MWRLTARKEHGLPFKTQHWISTKEELPDKPGTYLCCVEAPYYYPVRLMEYEPIEYGAENARLWKEAIGGAGYVYDWFVRYWMPLPKPPKEGAKRINDFKRK